MDDPGFTLPRSAIAVVSPEAIRPIWLALGGRDPGVDLILAERVTLHGVFTVPRGTHSSAHLR